MEYTWKNGSHISVPAKIAGEMCDNLAAKGCLTADMLVEINRPEDAPLHGAFEWRDDVAAEEYRKQQARHIISCICIKREEAEPVKMFYNIERQSPVYKSIEAILKSPDDTEALLRTALGELNALQRKYAEIKRLAPVWDAVQSVKMDEPGGGTEEGAA